MQFVSGGDPLFAEVLEPRAASRALGSAPTLVLLHPTPLNHCFWLPVVETVSQSLPAYRIVLPDLRGHGKSPLGAVPKPADKPVLTIEQLAADTVALLDTLHVEQAIFAGCSIGGYTLYELWRVAPERVAGLVFSASKPQADTDAERAKRSEWIARMEPARLRGDSRPVPEFIEAMLAALLSQGTQRDRPALVAEVRAMMEQVRPEAIQAIQRGLGQRPDARQTARTIRVPSCVIAGAEDTSSTPADLSALHSSLVEAGSRSSYHLLASAGHYGPIEQPASVAAILEAFCRSVVPSA